MNIHETKTQLSKLIEKVVGGESFVIAKSGKPVAKVVPLDAPKAARRLGFMSGEIVVPADFDRMGEEEIERLFGEKE